MTWKKKIAAIGTGVVVIGGVMVGIFVAPPTQITKAIVSWNYPSNKLVLMTFTLGYKTNLLDSWATTNVIGTNSVILPYNPKSLFISILRITDRSDTNNYSVNLIR